MPTSDSNINETKTESAAPENETLPSTDPSVEQSAANELPGEQSQDQSLDEQDTAEVEAAREAFDGDALSAENVDSGEETLSGDDDKLIELAQPFVGQWNNLISTTNWEKGRIIADWRQALIDSGAPSTEYSDEAWTRRVGGVTSPHVGRLRRVHERFVKDYESYQGLYWSHFLAALDWEDAPLWLEGASKESWSVSRMREQRWQAHGAVESNRPTSSQIVEVDTDEDVVMPAQGGGRTKEYGDDSGVESGPTYEGPDFGEEDELMSLAGNGPGAAAATQPVADGEGGPAPIVQPFAGLPELPEDLSDAVESFKLAVLRHKSAGWNDVDSDTIEKYLNAFVVLLAQP